MSFGLIILLTTKQRLLQYSKGMITVTSDIDKNAI